MRGRAVLLAAGALLPLPRLPSRKPPPPEPGPVVSSSGGLVRGRWPYRAIGVNYFDAFYRVLKDGSDRTHDAGFAALAAAEIPFARFMAGGYWPAEHRLVLDDPTEFFRRMDRVVRSAERHGIGLIPSLFWHSATVPDLEGEPRSAWGNPRSRTHKHMRSYVREVVGRYQTSPAIWGWEFGNEYALDANLPNAADWRPPVQPHLGTPTERTEQDDLTSNMIRTAFRAFANEVRSLDPDRIISTGNALPRPSAWHNLHDGTWSTDSPAQLAEMLLGDNPPPTDVISIHLYEADVVRLPDAASAAATAKRPLFVGEFGVPGSGAAVEATFKTMLDAIVTNRVALSALWVYDFADQPDFTVTPTNGRSWQLAAIAAANRRMRRFRWLPRLWWP